jgi:hypothetical protein
MTALREVTATYGIPMSLYTDRASWAFETARAGAKVDKTHLTHLGRALAKLGVEHIPSYSPQARGRSERLNGTLQGRVINELRCAGIATLDAANAYLRERYIPTHNESFSCAPREAESAFVAVGPVDLEQIFMVEEVRTVAKDNTVVLEGVMMQLGSQPGRRTCAGSHVTVRRHLDGSHGVWRGTQLLGRFDAAGHSLPPRAAVKPRPVEAAGPVGNRERMRLPTRTLDAGKRRRCPQLPQAPSADIS